jgi:hypothetical protein
MCDRYLTLWHSTVTKVKAHGRPTTNSRLNFDSPRLESWWDARPGYDERCACGGSAMTCWLKTQRELLLGEARTIVPDFPGLTAKGNENGR